MRRSSPTSAVTSQPTATSISPSARSMRCPIQGFTMKSVSGSMPITCTFTAQQSAFNEARKVWGAAAATPSTSFTRSSTEASM